MKHSINVLNPLPPPAPGEDGRKYKMLFAVTIINADGRVIAGSDEITLDPGEFHSYDFKRADLPLVGELGTGRLQMRTQIRYRFFAIVDRTQIQTSLELVDDSTGRTTLLLSAKPKEIVVVGSTQPRE